MDGNVSSLDYDAWNDHKFTELSSWCAGDFNADGRIGGRDLLIWNAHKGFDADSVAVPEPGQRWLTFWLLVLSAALHARR